MFLVNVLAGKDRKDKEKLAKQRAKAFEILNYLFEATEDGAKLFFANKEANEFIISFLKTIYNNYAEKEKIFINFIGVLNKIRVKKACQQVLFDNIFKKCRLI